MATEQDIPVGTEVSVAYGGKRRRGWIAEQQDRPVVRLYPKKGENEDFEVQDPRQIKVLKRQTIPGGWNAVDLSRPDGSPWVSLRFDDRFWEGLHHQARERGLTPEEQFMDYIHRSLDQAEADSN